MVIAEQRVNEQWMQISQTELATFSPRNRRTPRMPQRPPPPPPSPVEEQPVDPPHVPPPEEVLAQPLQPTSDAPGLMRAERRHRSTPPLRPSQPPAYRHGPQHHYVIVPAWRIAANDIWKSCPMCTETTVHSAVVCGQCGVRPACCRCMVFLELNRHSEGRCPFCRYSAPQ
jgi:hypothetical protein